MSIDINTTKILGVDVIYAYTLPGVDYLEGFIKIGQTGGQVSRRIAEQTRTAGLKPKLEWHDYAMYRDGSGKTFTDKKFHSWLVNNKKVEQHEEEGKKWEIFRLTSEESRKYFDEFVGRKPVVNENTLPYTLRPEQREAIEKTRAWFESNAEEQEFLWNAKPRFGKTLTTYELVRQMGLKKVLVVSNRPSISNSWAEDFYKFFNSRGEYTFVSDNDALKVKKSDTEKEKYKECVVTRQEYVDNQQLPRPMIAFESLQGLKGSVYFGGDYPKLKWMRDLEFDLLVVDESHEGVDTLKTERAFDNIKRRHTLYLSGTPFRQLASAQFEEEQIYNWSYADEQEAKESWKGPGDNPYASLPRLCLFTYQMSEIIRAKARKGITIGDNDAPVDCAFDLNEFFLTNERGKFVHEEDVKKFLRALGSQEKYPFSTPQLREELDHTLWHLNRVDSARALKKLLEEDEVFRDYKIVVAAGDEREGEDKKLKSLDLVKKAIAKYDKTITLTVGQLTVGVTVPEWSAVLMLCNLSSPAAYMQAAFRAQNACFVVRRRETEIDGHPALVDELRMKENAYVFDFDPARTLVIFEDFAVNLAPETAGGFGAVEDRQKKISRLLNFLPVIGEDEEGKMVELDAAQVLSIPRRLKSREVVERGFMSNFLFRNIGNIFSAPGIVRQIVGNLPTAIEERRKPNPQALDNIDKLPLDEEGNIDLSQKKDIGDAQGLFGEKIYEIVGAATQNAENIINAAEQDDILKEITEIGKSLKASLAKEIIAPIVKTAGIGKGASGNIEKTVSERIDKTIGKIAANYEQDKKIAEAVYKNEKKEATSDAEKEAAIKKRNEAIDEAKEEAKKSLQEAINDTLREAPAQVYKAAETARITSEKNDIENEVRAHLRGFARTIPSFIMAFGDENLKLANFEKYVDPEIFRSVTGITIENFIFLRDGGEYLDEKTGRMEHFAGHLFDELVFDDAVQEFLAKKKELANYFDESRKEDIFDYIPPQKTSQIFTPRHIVVKMIDMLESENPGCFDDPTHTFADLYMKSGLYISEIVKRLYKSEGLKKAFPDGDDRIRHILTRQVYGLAPSEIILRIATNYILGFDEKMRELSQNFKVGDAVLASKKGRLQELVNEAFGQPK